MVDTTPEIAAMVRERWCALSAERRLILTASMFDSARALVEASFPSTLSAAERKLRLCERLYGTEFAARCAAAFTRAGVRG